MVSIIIPAYQVGKYLEQTIKSALQQSYSDIEVLVIDDGSKDQTLEVARDLEQKDARLHVYTQTNQGVSAARNLGLSKASGDYVMFLDGDDILEEDAVEIMVSKLEETASDWVNCQYTRVNEKLEKLDQYDFLKGIFTTKEASQRKQLICAKLLNYQIGYEVWDKIYKKSILDQFKIAFPTDCKVGEDLAFNLCYAMVAEQICCIDNRLLKYRVREDSCMGQEDIQKPHMDQYLAIAKHAFAFLECLPEDKRYYERDDFPILYAKLMDAVFRGDTNEQAVERIINETGTVSLQEDLKFVLNFLLELNHKKEDYLEIYGARDGKCKWRGNRYWTLALRKAYHKDFNQLSMGSMEVGLGDVWILSIGQKLYDSYRKLRRRPQTKDMNCF